MREAGRACEQRSCVYEMRQMSRLLHDLCQPLTTLQCRLELATLTGTDQGYRRGGGSGVSGVCAVDGGGGVDARDCARRCERGGGPGAGGGSGVTDFEST